MLDEQHKNLNLYQVKWSRRIDEVVGKILVSRLLFPAENCAEEWEHRNISDEILELWQIAHYSTSLWG